MMEREKEERRSSASAASVKKEEKEKRTSIKITIAPPTQKAAAAVAGSPAAPKAGPLSTREAMKSFKSRRESLFGRVSEADSVCDSLSFLVILVPEKAGHPLNRSNVKCGCMPKWQFNRFNYGSV